MTGGRKFFAKNVKWHNAILHPGVPPVPLVALVDFLGVLGVLLGCRATIHATSKPRGRAIPGLTVDKVSRGWAFLMLPGVILGLFLVCSWCCLGCFAFACASCGVFVCFV